MTYSLAVELIRALKTYKRDLASAEKQFYADMVIHDLASRWNIDPEKVE